MRQTSRRAVSFGLLLVLSTVLEGGAGGTARTILVQHDDGTPASPFHGRYVLVHADGYALDQKLTTMYALKARTWRRAIWERLERDVAALGQRSDCGRPRPLCCWAASGPPSATFPSRRAAPSNGSAAAR